jgi:hypothetical protein
VCGSFQLPNLSEQSVPRWTVGDIGDLGFELRLLGCNSIFKFVGFGSATLHDTISCFTGSWTVGFALPTLKHRRRSLSSKVDTKETIWHLVFVQRNTPIASRFISSILRS